MAAAATRAMRETGARVKREGRAAIAAGGFGTRWQNALRVTVYPEKGESIEPAAYVKHKIPYAGVFETGARIGGRPLLWLPLSNVQQRFAGRHMTPRLYVQAIGPLHTLKRPGKHPLLGGYVTLNASTEKLTVAKLRAGMRAKPSRRKSVPVFVGISSVELHQRFDLASVVKAAGDALPGILTR